MLILLTTTKMSKKQKEFEKINNPKYEFDPENLPHSFDVQETDWVAQYPLDTTKISANTFKRIMKTQQPQSDDQFCDAFSKYMVNKK
jgi:hypothetical protein